MSLWFFVTQTPKNAAFFRARKQQLSSGGFTIVELLISLAIVATLTAIAVPLTQDYIYKADLARACTEIRGLEKEILFFRTERGFFPGGGPGGNLVSLQDIGRVNFLDPWGTPYQYRNLENGPWSGDKPQFCRRDRSYNPLNFDFDLYSVGPDRRIPTHNQITKAQGADDIVRAANGKYVGEGSKF